VYEKRGKQDERWVDRYGEEICKVGTHVPAGSSSDHKHTDRKNEVVKQGGHELILAALHMHVDSVDVVRMCFESLQYLLSGDERTARLERLIPFQPEAPVCAAIKLHMEREGLVETGCTILEALSCSLDIERLSEGDIVDAQWRRRGNTAYPGRISRVRDDVTYDVVYDDGDREERVTRDRITLRATDRSRWVLPSSIPVSLSHCSLCSSNSAFVRSLQRCAGVDVLLELLGVYRSKESVTAPCVSILSVFVDEGGEELAARFTQAGGHLVVTQLLQVRMKPRTA
jgi:hypothetical protein